MAPCTDYSAACGNTLLPSTVTITGTGGTDTLYYPANTWMPNNWYPYINWPPFYPYPYQYYYWPTFYPTNEAALRETIREKEAVIEEMRELVKMQRRLLDAILPKDAGE